MNICICIIYVYHLSFTYLYLDNYRSSYMHTRKMTGLTDGSPAGNPKKSQSFRRREAKAYVLL